jgi:hypothetical protein
MRTKQKRAEPKACPVISYAGKVKDLEAPEVDALPQPLGLSNLGCGVGTYHD